MLYSSIHDVILHLLYATVYRVSIRKVIRARITRYNVRITDEYTRYTVQYNNPLYTVEEVGEMIEHKAEEDRDGKKEDKVGD